MILSCQALLIQLFSHLKHQNLSSGDSFIYSSGIILLVTILAIREAVAPLANDPIMSGTSICLFRHLEHQTPSSNAWDNFVVPILPTGEAVALLANDPFMLGRSMWSFRYLERQNKSFISGCIDLARGGKILSCNFGHQGVSGATCK